MVAVVFGHGTKHDAFTGKLTDPHFLGCGIFSSKTLGIPKASAMKGRTSGKPESTLHSGISFT